MIQIINLEGKNFGRWRVIGLSDRRDRHGRYFQKCICECGVERDVATNALRQGRSKSCGCFNIDTKKWTKHNLSKTRIYTTWADMLQRCTNQKSHAYQYYGGRGIKVCSEWTKFEPFYDWAMNNGYNEKLTIDRNDVNGNYEPSNCSWITKSQQCNNTRRTIFITHNNEKMTLMDWSEKLNIPIGTLYVRYYRNMRVSDILSTIKLYRNQFSKKK